MDHRTPLKPHTILAFEGMPCHIEEVIGQGSNAIVYKGWYQDALNPELRHQVLIKELFPYHPRQKIRRQENGCITVEEEARDLWNTHRESFEVGNVVHLRLLQDHPDRMVMGANLNSFSCNDTLYSVLGYSGGRSLQTELNSAGVSLSHTVRRMMGLLDALEAFHKSGYLHLDISPDNIMLVGREEQERLFLIDYNSARELGSRDNSYLSCKAGYSAPEVSTGNPDTLGFSADLYSVAAVFYRCLMGRTLTLAEVLQPKAPDGQDSPLLKDMPQTVCSMVSAILKKGLQTLPLRRYRSIGQMRQAFQELLDRIGCVGVTHWSLWENGRRSVEELIRINPALGYLKEENKLYPIRLEGETSLSLNTYLDRLMSPEGKSGIILAQGGMGKTTLLLHTATLQAKRYSAAAPAVFYISLNGWDKSTTHYIRSQILMRLRFKPEENTFDSALHALHQLLEQPLKTRTGTAPVVLLLLDGLNEIRGDIAPLIQEIHELDALAGVRILATSRSEIPELKLEPASLMPLHTEDIEEALGKNGLLIPRKPEMLQLLRTPLILSIYIQASEGGRQPDICSEAELMNAYMDSLLEKEIRQLPEDSPQRWQLDAALNYVLPAIAAEAKRKGKGLSERQILNVVKKCRKFLRSWRMQKTFPRWIGHTRDIFHNAHKADEWYAVMVHQLLWQRCGMLIRDTNGRYRVFHHAFSDHLAQVSRMQARRTRPGSNPLNVIAWIWCILLLITIYNNYHNNLRWDAEGISDSYREPQLSVTVQFWDLRNSVEDYLEDPNARNYQTAASALSRTWLAAEEQFPKFENQTLLELSRLDGWMLTRKNRNPEYLMAYDTGYISENTPTFLLNSVKSDYIIMLSTLDTALEQHRAGQMSRQELFDLVMLTHSIDRQRNELTELLGLWYEYPEPDYVGDCAMEPEDIEAAIASLESLCRKFCEKYAGFPMELQEQIQERITASYENLWWDNLQSVSPVLPSGWTAPSWLPEDAEYFCSFLHPVSLNIGTAAYNPEGHGLDIAPFAWHTVCFDISREDLMQYLETLEESDVAYTLHDRGKIIQATIHFPETDLFVSWTQQQTTLTLTGFDTPAENDGEGFAHE